ncbi:MAG: PqqD family protein [Actinomycetota bacterium]|nr:PqqD family protein [Actinomycetota bacterium]
MSGTLDSAAVIRRRSGVVHRQLSDERAVLLDLDSARYFGLSTVGSVIWELLETPCPLSELVERLRPRFDDPPTTMERDIEAFVAALYARALVEVCNADGC